MKPKNIELNIEELVLHGFSPGERHRISEAVEQELSRILADEGVPQSLERGGEIAGVDGGAIEMTEGASAEATGAQVLRAMYGGLRE